MMWTAVKRLGALCLTAALLCAGGSAFSQDDGTVFFTGVSGQAVSGKATVLLRWYAADGDLPYETYSVYRQAGGLGSGSPLEKISETQRLRNEPLIRSICEQPRNARALTELIDVLQNLYESPIGNDEYAGKLIAVLDGDDATCTACTMRRNMLVQSNYLAAIVEGLGYLDAPAPGVYGYELRTSSNGGDDDVILGRIEVDATAPSQLPEPAQPEEVDVPGIRGHLKVFLKWDMTPDLEDHRDAMFGYNVYRADGDRSSDSFSSLLASGALRKMNRLPLLTPSSQALGDSPEEGYLFADDNRTFGRSGPTGAPFRAGDEYTYWVAARDLLGQLGKASDPTVALVQDKQAPLIPRGLSATARKLNATPEVSLTWDRNPDDARSYNIYRFRRYDHAGHDDAYSPIDGMTEGLIASVPQPATGAPSFTDHQIQYPDMANMAYWYCVSAVDFWGNESAMSPPERGVLFDITPPEPPAQPLICVHRRECMMTDFKLVSDTPRTESKEISHVTFILIRDKDDIAAAIIQTSNNQGTDYKTLFSEKFPKTGRLTFEKDIDPYGKDEGRYFEFSFIGADGERCGPYPVPERFQNALYSPGKDLVFEIHVNWEYKRHCAPAGHGPVRHDPYNDMGGIEPVEFTFKQTDDAYGVALYRSPDCENFYAVDEVNFDGASELTVLDAFRPEQGARVCYAARTYDENHNFSSMTYLTSQVLFPTLESSLIVPSMQSATPLGTSSAPETALTWLGPSSSVAGFRIYFSTDESGTSSTSVLLSPSEYSYDGGSGLYTALLSYIDDETGAGLSISQTYYITAEAVLQNGETYAANNNLSFIWSAEPEDTDVPAWPVRGMPPSGDSLSAKWLPSPSSSTSTAPPQPFTYGAGVQIGVMIWSSAKETGITYEHTLSVEPPFIVYRKRTDKTGQAYQQISPLIESINFDATNGEVRDPFFTMEEFTDNKRELALYFLDTVRLIQGAKYEYKIVQLNGDSGEIAREYGPSNDVEVMGP
ncbi:MAG: hypothetical protein GC154_15070 [bacterium]|nr:hypothetical protein [bacterium]